MNKYFLAATAALLVSGAASAATQFSDRAAFNAAGSGSGFYTDLNNLGSTRPLPFNFGPIGFSGTFGTAMYWGSEWAQNIAGVNGNVDGTAWIQLRLNTFNGPVTWTGDTAFQLLGFDVRAYFDNVGVSDGGESVNYVANTGESGIFALPATNTAAFVGIAFDAPVTSVTFSIGADHVNGFTWFGVDNLQLWATAAPVPEPETWGLMMGGIGLLAAMMRRRPV